jgi:hypothetical protein
MIDHFAEHLSRHGDVQKAASALGKSRGWGQAALRAIRKELGEQAK